MGENNDLFGLIISLGAGLFAILGAIFNWDFFFRNTKSSLFMSLFGRNGARVFYAALGLFLIYMGFQIGMDN